MFILRCRTCSNIKKGKDNRDKISKSLKGRKLSVEHCMNISKGGIGRKVSEQTREKISKSQPYKGLNHQTNTGRTHFKKGLLPWNFKGGISNLYNYSRNDLYTLWKKPILERDSYTCQMCGTKGGVLNVHHNNERMIDIINKFKKDKSILSYEEKKIISNLIVDYHLKNNISGITVCNKCHRKLHKD
jgi:hypothetical protein